jgi:hypothetical protein
MTDSDKLRRLADWFSTLVTIARSLTESDSDEIQQDLRRIADELEQGSQGELSPGSYTVLTNPLLEYARRSEQCKIKMVLENEAAHKHAKDVKVLTGLDTKKLVAAGDGLHINWELLLEYFGDTVSKLSAINRICKNPDVVLSVDCKLLEKSQCLVFDVFTRLMQVRQTIKER